ARRTAGCPPRLRPHPRGAEDGPRAIAAAVEEHQHPRGIAPRHDRPFALPPAEIDLFEPHVVRDRPGRANFADALPPLGPTDWTRFCRQQLADLIDFTHGTTPSARALG